MKLPVRRSKEFEKKDMSVPKSTGKQNIQEDSPSQLPKINKANEAMTPKRNLDTNIDVSDVDILPGIINEQKKKSLTRPHTLMIKFRKNKNLYQQADIKDIQINNVVKRSIFNNRKKTYDGNP